MSDGPAQRLCEQLHGPNMIEAVEAYDGVTARIAEQVGFEAIVVGGGLASNFVYGLPDIGVVSVAEIIAVADRLAGTVSIPVIVDVDDAGPTPAHIRRTIEMAERSQVAGVMVEDTDCSSVKHLWSDEAGGRDFSDNTLYPLDVALDRLAVALESRRSRDDLLVLARTDMWHQNTPDAHDEALERARRYAGAGADFVLITGMKGVDVTADVVASIGAPIIHAEDEGVSGDERRRLAAAGVKVLFHWLVPFTAAFAGYKSALEGLRTDSLVLDHSPFEINDELLRTVDLPGWSNVANRVRPDRQSPARP